MTTSSRHLVGVWNPSYEADAMDAHVAVLLRQAREHRAGAREEDFVYVWWGKVRSPHRQERLPHLPEILALDEILRGSHPPELHLYLTDYRSLYVGHVAGITDENVADSDEELEHLPAYYRDKGLQADCWFQLWDIRRVVLDDTPAVIRELRRLRNTHYHGRPVSLYGGMVDLPLVVTRDDGARWFEPAVRAQLTDGRHWVEFDAEHAGSGAMQRELRENRFGNAAWERLDPAARSFVASAEQTFRAHRHDAAFALATVVVDFGKAVEVQVNALLRQALAGAPERLRLANVDGVTVDVVDDGPFTLGALAAIIDGDEARAELLERRLANGRWFVSGLPAVLRDLKDARNPAAHGEAVARERVVELRNALVGVGVKGSLLELAQVHVR